MKLSPFPLLLLIHFFWISPVWAQTEKGDVNVDGFSLGYTIAGDGPTTALVIGSSIYYPRAFSDNIHKHLKMVYIDHRGFTKPPTTGNHDYTLERVIADMEHMRSQLGLDKFIIIGHSGHSFMALEYAKRYPEHVSHIVLIGTAPDFGPENQAWIEREWSESVDLIRKSAQDEWLQKIPDEELESMNPGEAFVLNYVRSAPHAWYDPYFDCSHLWEGMDINVPMFDYMWGKVFAEIDIRKGLSELDIPVFIALGRYDNLVAPPASWDPYRSYFNDLTLRVFEKSGHTPMFEQPAEFDREMLEWLEIEQ